MRESGAPLPSRRPACPAASAEPSPTVPALHGRLRVPFPTALLEMKAAARPASTKWNHRELTQWRLDSRIVTHKKLVQTGTKAALSGREY